MWPAKLFLVIIAAEITVYFLFKLLDDLDDDDDELYS